MYSTYQRSEFDQGSTMLVLSARIKLVHSASYQGLTGMRDPAPWISAISEESLAL